MCVCVRPVVEQKKVSERMLVEKLSVDNFLLVLKSYWMWMYELEWCVFVANFFDYIIIVCKEFQKGLFCAMMAIIN